MLKQALSRKPADPVLRGSYAEALILNNEPVAAERQLRQALKLGPDNPEILSKVARCHAMLGREEDARRTFEYLIARDPKLPSALIAYADFLIQVGEQDKARAVYRQALDLGISPAHALAGLANCKSSGRNRPSLPKFGHCSTGRS